jgi:hypothetical protein
MCGEIETAVRTSISPERLSPNQVHNAFHVVGLRKQIHQMDLLDAITDGEQGNQIAGQGCRIA